MSTPQAQPELLVQGQNLAVSQGGRTILQNMQLDLAYGEFVYLIGRTGAGKTSLLRLLYADLKPAQGTLRVDEFSVERMKPRQIPLLRRRLGIVFQDFQLLPHLTVYENVAFALRCTGWKNRKHIDDRVHEVLQQVGMHPHAARYPHEISGGEQQRTSIARALVNKPVLLITDEPTGNLDPEATERVLELLWDVNRHGTAILMATHTHGLIDRRPARVLEVAEGTLLDRGLAARRPKTQVGAA